MEKYFLGHNHTHNLNFIIFAIYHFIMDRVLEIKYQHYSSLEELPAAQRQLLEEAQAASARAVAPYSNFKVGAAVRLRELGVVESSVNVESEVYPAGICAERNLLFNAATAYPSDSIVELAVTSLSTSEECYPCGLCRQTILDTERRQGSPIKVIMAGSDSATVVESASALLPFAFKL